VPRPRSFCKLGSAGFGGDSGGPFKVFFLDGNIYVLSEQQIDVAIQIGNALSILGTFPSLETSALDVSFT